MRLKLIGVRAHWRCSGPELVTVASKWRGDLAHPHRGLWWSGRRQRNKMAAASLREQLARSTGKQSGVGQNDVGEDRVVHDAFYRAKVRRGIGRETAGEVDFNSTCLKAEKGGRGGGAVLIYEGKRRWWSNASFHLLTRKGGRPTAMSGAAARRRAAARPHSVRRETTSGGPTWARVLQIARPNT
jgi:hypothetical protein